MINNFIRFEEDTHTYWSQDGFQYKSVSKVIESVKNKFDKERMSTLTAAKQNRTKEDVLKEWQNKTDNSIDWGKKIHNALELYHKTTELPEDTELAKMVIDVSKKFLTGWDRQYEEVVLHTTKYKVAGTADKLLLRTKRNNIFDIRDYKTNFEKGIQFKNKYNKFLLEPLSHLEDCNFIHYTLQQSIYGLMLEDMGYRIGSLGIIFIDRELKSKLLPIPYMKLEAIELLKLNSITQKTYNEDGW